MSDEKILMERDRETGIARVTFNHPEKRNSYDKAMRDLLARHLDVLADDDDIKVVLLRGNGGVFSTGADMGNAYAWYDEKDAPDGVAPSPRAERRKTRRPSQRRRLGIDRRTFDFYHSYLGYPKVTIAEVSGYALGGGFELALMSDVSVVARDAKVGMPATRFLGPALGSLPVFFHRLGPVVARRMLLTGDVIAAGDITKPDVFTEIVDPADVTARADWYARKIAKMPADGISIAKESFRLIESLTAYQGEEVLGYLVHAYGTNLQFEDDEFNFVKTRKEHGTSKAFQLRDEFFEVPEPGKEGA